MDGEWSGVVETIQTSGYKAAIVVSGGGSGALYALLSHPGASRFVLEAQVPYSPEALFDYLGEKLDQSCSAEAAVIMAERAFERALVFSLSSKVEFPILGMACTAALQTNRERKGSDRAFICIKSRKSEMTRALDLVSGRRTEQEEELSVAILETIVGFVTDVKE